MRTAFGFSLVWACLVSGCDSALPTPNAADTTPHITPEDRARMPIEERDDPYVLERLVTRPND